MNSSTILWLLIVLTAVFFMREKELHAQHSGGVAIDSVFVLDVDYSMDGSYWAVATNKGILFLTLTGTSKYSKASRGT